MAKTQTAVEWLDGVLDSILDLTPIQFSSVRQAIEKAKEMEKEQIIIAYQSERYPCSDADAKQYYTDTYESNI